MFSDDDEEDEEESVVCDEREEFVYVERLETVKFLNMTVVESSNG